MQNMNFQFKYQRAIIDSISPIILVHYKDAFAEKQNYDTKVVENLLEHAWKFLATFNAQFCG